MREDREYGHSDPGDGKDIISAATHLYCSMCDTSPCYLLTTAAMAVMQEQLTEERNLIGVTRYAEHLERLQSCLTRHTETVREVWHLDTCFKNSKEAWSNLEKQETGIENGKSYNHNGGP